MEMLVPEYYTKFKCSADKCSDNCCIGWEIGIDPATMGKYNSLGEEQRGAVLDTVNFDGEPTFRLDCHGRCANLDCHGLCKIISDLGEDYLCQICRDHPRYFNRTSEVIEGGIGIACEEAARLILSSADVVSTVTVDYHDVTPRYTCLDSIARKARGHIFTYLNSADLPREKAEVVINRLLKFAELLDDVIFENSFSEEEGDLQYEDLKNPEWNAECPRETILDMCRGFEGIEVLCDGFTHKLNVAASVMTNDGFYSFLDGSASRCFTNLLTYFIHRYFLCDEVSHLQSMRFAIASALLISAAVYLSGDHSIESYISEAKEFSKNVEYSEENVEKILEELENIHRS